MEGLPIPSTPLIDRSAEIEHLLRLLLRGGDLRSADGRRGQVRSPAQVGQELGGRLAVDRQAPLLLILADRGPRGLVHPARYRGHLVAAAPQLRLDGDHQLRRGLSRLRRGRMPERDLWPGIQARLKSRRAAAQTTQRG